jgi:hypothetical protein
LFRDRKKSRNNCARGSFHDDHDYDCDYDVDFSFSYNSNLAYLLARKCQGKEIEGDGAVQRLVELRTVIEKIRQQDPLNNIK